MPNKKKVDINKALDLKINHNLSYAEIGKMQDVSAQAIHQSIKAFLPKEDTEVYKVNRADILTEVQRKLITNLDVDRLKSATVNNLAYAFTQFHNAERLERGRSTANVAYSDISDKLDVIKSEREQLRVEREKLESGIIDI